MRLAVRLPLRCDLLGSLLLLSAACGDDGEAKIPPIVWEGEHVKIGTKLNLDDWCPGTLPALDRRIGALKNLFGVSREHVVYYYLYPVSDPDYPCRDRARACAPDGNVYTIDLPDNHEIVHAISHAHRSMPYFFEEGAASYWGVSAQADFRGLDIHEVLERSRLEYIGLREYALAAHFTSYLVDTYGLELYVALFREASANQSLGDLEETFESVMGLTLTEVILVQQPRSPSGV